MSRGWGACCGKSCSIKYGWKKRRKLILASFISKIAIGNECWEWHGYRFIKGYGQARWKLDNGRSEVEAHRISWLIFRGPIPMGQQVLHSCDNHPCVRPKHLFLGSQKDNMQDCLSKNRFARGEKQWKSRLTTQTVIAIRRLRNTGLTYRQLSKQFNVGYSTIGNLLQGNTWKHI